jgi:hypothetical protein
MRYTVTIRVPVDARDEHDASGSVLDLLARALVDDARDWSRWPKHRVAAWLAEHATVQVAETPTRPEGAREGA